MLYMQIESQHPPKSAIVCRLSAFKAQRERDNTVDGPTESPHAMLRGKIQALILGMCVCILPASAQSFGQPGAAQPPIAQEVIRAEQAADSTPPTLVNQPVNWVTTPGAAGGFSVTAQGTQPLKYQWSFNNAPLRCRIAWT